MSNTERMNSFVEAVGHWLKEARLQAGLSISEAANRITTTQDEIAGIESGQSTLTGADFYLLIEAYSIPADAVNAFLQDFGLKST